MALYIKIGVLYGTPVLAVVLALAWFALLLRRVRRGATPRAKAAALYPLVVLLPVAALFVIWGTAELASYLEVPAGRYVWDSNAALQLFISLLPIGAYVGIPVVVLLIAFWVTLARSSAR